MEIKSEKYEILKDGKVVRVVYYYPIADIRKVYLNYINELEKKLGKQVKRHISIKPINVSGVDYLVGELKIFTGDDVIIYEEVCLPISYAFTDQNLANSSFEIAKVISRIEKRLYMMLLGLEDPEEAYGEIEDIEKVESKKDKENKDLPITQPQLRSITNIINNEKDKGNKILEYIKAEFGKDKIEDLTKLEASKVFEFINRLIKEG